MLSILIGAAIGALIGCAIIGLCQIISAAKELFDQYRNSRTQWFLPKKELKKYLRGKPRLKSVLDAVNDNDDATGAFLVFERGRVDAFQLVDKELDDEVDSRGYKMYRGDDNLYLRA